MFRTALGAEDFALFQQGACLTRLVPVPDGESVGDEIEAELHVLLPGDPIGVPTGKLLRLAVLDRKPTGQRWGNGVLEHLLLSRSIASLQEERPRRPAPPERPAPAFSGPCVLLDGQCGPLRIDYDPLKGAFVATRTPYGDRDL